MEVKTFQGIFKARHHDNMTHQGVEDVHSPHAAAKEKLHGYKTFYLHDDGALNFEKEVACVAKHFNISNNPTGGAREQKRGHLNWDTGGSTLKLCQLRTASRGGGHSQRHAQPPNAIDGPNVRQDPHSWVSSSPGIPCFFR